MKSSAIGDNVTCSDTMNIFVFKIAFTAFCYYTKIIEKLFFSLINHVSVRLYKKVLKPQAYIMYQDRPF